MKKPILILFAFCVCRLAEAQQRIGNFMAWGRDNGLPPSLYFGVYQSKDGYLWMGSSSGLVRFDGKRFKTFISDPNNPNSPSDNEISDFAEDDKGNLWICGSIQGLTRYNKSNGTFRRYPKLSVDNTPGYGIHKVLKDRNGKLWFATDGRGLALYIPHKDSFELFIPDRSRPYDGSARDANHITSIAEDRKDPDLLWLSAFDGLYSFHKSTGKFTKYPLVSEWSPDGRSLFMCLTIDKENRIWLGTWFRGLYCFDPDKESYTNFLFPRKGRRDFEYAVPDIKQINDSIFYLASFNEGLLSFNKRNSEFKTLLATSMLPQGSSGIDIHRISLTPSAGIFVGGNYYIYQEHASFNRLGNFKAINLKTKVQPEATTHLSEAVFDEGRDGFWLGYFNSHALHFLSKNLQQEKIYALPPGEFGLFDLDVDIDGNVWMAGIKTGLARMIRAGNIISSGIELPDTLFPMIRQMERGKDDLMWLSTRKHLIRYRTRSHTSTIFTYSNYYSKPASPLKYAYLETDQKGDAWIYTDNGLFHAKANADELKLILPETSGMANPAIKSMAIDKSGYLWLGYHYSGLQIMDPVSYKVLSTHTMNEGMPGMQVNSLSCDTAGRIWAGFAAGLAMFDPKVKVWQLFNRNDGIRKDYTDGEIIATGEGRIILAQPDGFIHFSGEQYKAVNQEPILHITSLRVNGKILYAPLPEGFEKTIELPYKTSEISIEYAAMDWLYPLRTKYFYRVENIHAPDGWISNDDASINLAGLSAGAYVIHLYAVNGGGIKSKVLQLPIVIHPPFWMRWWFLALSALLFLSIVYLLYRYRIRQIKKLQEMRNVISRNLHDDIGASLSNIHILNELAARNIENREKARNYLVKAGEDIQRISESLSDIVWNINPRYDDLDNLFIRMKRYAADMLDGKNIESELVFPEFNIQNHSLPMDQRRDFYLIFKEAVNNLAKYSAAAHATIAVSVNTNRIKLLVVDDGKGFDVQHANTGNGLQNMKQRADRWNAELIIQSGRGKGTSVMLTMSF